MQQNELGFEFDEFTIFDGFNGSGFCYFNEEGHCFYTCNINEAENWWNEESMDITLNCPFCETSVGGFYDKDRPYVKHWMGKHLAIFHADAIEEVMKPQDQDEDYEEDYKGWYC